MQNLIIFIEINDSLLAFYGFFALFDEMAKDSRAHKIKVLIESDAAKSLNDVFEFIPPTVVSEETGIHYTRIKKWLTNTSTMNIGDLRALAGYFDVEVLTIFKLAMNTGTPLKKGVRKK